MIITINELQNDLHKFLKLIEKEDIIIKEDNGNKKIARLVEAKEGNNIEVKEGVAPYNFDGVEVSYEEFIKISTSDNKRYEYINGKIHLLASPAVNHQRIIRKIFGNLITFFADKKCEPFSSPFDVTLYKGKKEDKNINIVQPDLLVICDQDNIDENDRYIGTPELIIEVLSKTNINHDVITKLELYRTTSIKEYWIVNPFSKEINLFSFGEVNIKEIITYKKKEVLRSHIFTELQVNLRDVF